MTISAIRIDKENESITGFYHLLNNSMPGRSFHAGCKIIFSGRLSNNYSISIHANNANKPLPKAIDGKLIFDGKHSYSSNSLPEQEYRIKLNENLAGCAKDIDISDNEIQFSVNIIGEWKRISAIRSIRSYFHSEPGDLMVRKAFLVSGDIIYVYDEKPGWYYVKFQGLKKESIGWIKKSDTLQFDQ